MDLGLAPASMFFITDHRAGYSRRAQIAADELISTSAATSDVIMMHVFLPGIDRLRRVRRR